MTNINIPKLIKGSCVLGALLADEGGFLSENRTRSIIVQKDANNTVPVTFNSQQVEGQQSQRLISVPQSANGLIPSVNPFIGAPRCTFVYGGITPQVAHPQINLVSGPLLSATYTDANGNQVNYNPNFNGGTANFSGTTGDGSNAPKFITPSDGTTPAREQYPTIPSVTGGLFNATQINTTYNIWKLLNVSPTDDANFKIKQNFGPIPPSGWEGPRISQVTTADGLVEIQVNASNTSALVGRLFPMSYDLAYSGQTLLYYPDAHGVAIAPRTIGTTGSDNCGFQLHFRHSAVGQSTNTTGNLNSGITIIWGSGNYPTKTSNRIQQFKMTLDPNKPPMCYYYHPKKFTWERITVSGPVFGKGDYEVYVHFCGPQMMVGFDTDASQWDCFVPPVDDVNGSNFYYPHIPIDSQISLQFDNISAIFSYAPIAFNNYNPENIFSSADVKSGSDLSSFPVYFTVPESQVASITEDNIDAFIQANGYIGTESEGNMDKHESTPSYYGDWRNKLVRPFYIEKSRTITAEGTGKNIVQVTGLVRFTSTIEGPMFISVRNTKLADQNSPFGSSASGSSNNTTSTYGANANAETTTNNSSGGTSDIFILDANPDKPLIRPLSWGDISAYMTGFNVSYDLKTENRSRLTATADVTLQNIDSTVTGRQILHAISTNCLAITVGAGYNSPETFFQGVVENVSVQRGPTGSTHILHCVDITQYTVDRIPFSEPLYFTGMRYGRIIETAMQMGGLSKWFVIDYGSDIFQNALNWRLGLQPADSSLAQKIISANQRNKIKDIVEPILGLIIDKDSLPLFMWDFNYQRFRLMMRNSEDYVDDLVFVGVPQQDGSFLLPNAYNNLNGDEGVHGVLEGTWTETTNLKQLHSGILLLGPNYYNNIISYSNIDPLAFSEAGLQTLEESVSQKPNLNDTEQGYVGARLTFFMETESALLPDQNSINNYGEQLYTDFLRTAYKSIKFSCQVEQALTHFGKFRILSFQTDSSTDTYFYRSVQYTCNIETGVLKADVVGEVLPSLVLNGTENSRSRIGTVG